MFVPLRLTFCYLCALAVSVSVLLPSGSAADDDTVRVFIFAGQSNMVGSDSKVKDIARFPPFVGIEKPQPDVRFSYCLGRENKTRSDGWVDLQPVNGVVGPELSFAWQVKEHLGAPLAIIKCAAGGTHLGGDWNPDNPQGFKMYPLAMDLVKSSLAKLDAEGVKYRIEGFVWHQGENDMFNEQYMANYGKNLANFVARWRKDLGRPELKFYVGELCTKTIWGMDLRPRMYAISQGQKSVAAEDPQVEYIPTAHIGVEIGNPVGLHYHYGTLGQLQHGQNYANAYLRTIGRLPKKTRPLKGWPYPKSSKVNLFILAGHRNMEGERAFVQQLPDAKLREDQHDVAFKYSLGGGVRVSDGWEPLGITGLYDNFGPELSFAQAVRAATSDQPVAIAKFTHSGSQIIDWTPAGSMAKSRNLYPRFIQFVQQSVKELEAHGHTVDIAGVFYHLGENDMSMPPYRKKAGEWLKSFVQQSRKDLHRPELRWFVSQQPPTDHKNVNNIDVVADIEAVAAADKHLIHIKAFDLPPQEKRLVLDTQGVLSLGKEMAKSYLAQPAHE